MVWRRAWGDRRRRRRRSPAAAAAARGADARDRGGGSGIVRRPRPGAAAGKRAAGVAFGGPAAPARRSTEISQAVGRPERRRARSP